jgi:hypothetical protein
VTVLKQSEKIHRIALGCNTRRLLTLSDPKEELQLWDTATGEPAGKPFHAPASVSHLDLAEDGRTVLIGNHGRTFRLYQGETGEPIGKEVDIPGNVAGAEISADGKLAVAGCRDFTLHLIDMVAGQVRKSEKLHNQLDVVAFAGDGKSVVTGTWSSTVFQRAVPSFEPIGKPVGVHGAVLSLAVTRDGRTFLAGAHGPYNSILGQTVPGRTLGLPLRHYARQAVFSPGGDIVMTGSDPTMRLWDVRSGKQVGPNLTHPGIGTGGCRRSVFFADDRTLVSAGTDKMVRRWPVPVPIAGTPERLTLWVQALTGMALDAHGGIAMLPATEWQRIRDRLDAQPTSPLP